MLKPLFFASMAAALALTMGYADQPQGKLTIPAPKTDPTNGKMMFTSYCAPCHGADEELVVWPRSLVLRL